MLVGVLPLGAVDSPLLADSHSYLPSLPLAVAAALGLLHGSHALRSGFHLRFFARCGLGAAGVVCLGLGYLTWKQTQVWQNSEQLWTHTTAVSRSSAAHKHMAARLESENRDEDAVEHYRRAIITDPSDWDTHYKLALLLQGRSRMQEAVDHYRAAVKINPAATRAHNQLAFALMGQGNLKESAEHFQKVLELTLHGGADSQSNAKRAKHFRKVHELDPDPAEAHFRLGGIAAVQGEYDKAVDHFQSAIKVSPDFAEAFLNLGFVQAAQGNLTAAAESFRKAISIRPTSAQAHESLGRALAEQGKKEEAAKHLQEAIRLLKLSPTPR
jgi:tetratricopeptide (TPR) repeat protein